MTTVPIAKLRAFARTLRRPRTVPVAYYSRVVGVVEAGSGTIIWTPNEPQEGPIAPITVDEYLHHEAKGADRDHC